jgi:hypothetical protein
MSTDTAAHLRRIGREALRLSHTAQTATERGNARELYESIVADLRAGRGAL